ncbi:protein AUXIN-REGULATED GENE INVOLVED IN ORGAN SIZE-like [Phragmites australis]|uniref:protein AUXIN-REGULATED GENE INVOLVED IN ORGAN SIZE-like n=1 Tax=Phragmites australis TaxID=29695 RepID=UPI002D78967B|nr:protein AUXIN-REGULATED GENE INVOLVED IN ORGAN SIZE-like [Phragmites australis]
MVVERRVWRNRTRRSSSPGGAAACGGMRGAEGKQQGRVRPAAPGQRYFTAGLAVLFLCLTALLVFLPLVLPPLPPPPLLLLLVPVGLMAVLLALALVPSDGLGTSGVASPCLH